MSDNKRNEFKINGVQYKCRTCFDPGRQVYPLTDKYNESKNWRQLLMEVAQLNVSDNEFLPNTICCKCLDKLVSYKDFLLQVENVSKKYFELITNCKNTSKDTASSNVDNVTECLAESQIALPLEQFVTEIKLEDERLVPYDIVWADTSHSQEGKKDLENTDVNNSFKETCKENVEGEDLQVQHRSVKEEINDLFKGDLNETSSSSSSSEENDCLPEKRKKKGDGKKNTKSSQYAQQENKNVCKSIDKPVKCNTCKRSFSSQLYLRLHIRTIHRSFTSSSEDEDRLTTSESLKKKSAKKKHPDVFKITQVGEHFICPVCKKSFTLHRNCRRHVLTIHGPEKNMFPCGFCDHIASCEVYLINHIQRWHPCESFKSNRRQLIYRFGDHIYSKPSPWRLVECKLCSTNFITTKQLRQHLQNHRDPRTLDSLELDSNIVQRWFPGMDLNSVKAIISKNIREEDWFRYYTVLNEFWFELSISDTEEEDLKEDQLAERPRKYNCELCAKDFSFKYQIYGHLKEEHFKNEMPFKCHSCKLEFVSLNMYEQHKQIHCRNEYKNFQCSYCPGKFFSKHNMENHSCAGKTSGHYIMKTPSDPNPKSLNQKLLENTKHDTLNPVENILDSDTEPKHIDEFLRISKNQKLFENLNDAASSMSAETQQNHKNKDQLNENQTSSSKLPPAEIQRNHTESKVEIQNHEQTPLNDNTLKTFNTFSRMSENIILCGFCAFSFRNLKDLRQHMPLHSDGKTSINFDDCLYVKQFESSKIIDYAELEQQIRNAYIKHQISRFYQAIDKYGNELDISDSDSNEDDDDDGEIVKKNYMCDVCKETFTKRKRLLKHQQERHKEDLMPFTCQDCKMQYVSIHLLQQHLKRDCWNEHRRIAEQCTDCKARIIWPCNMLMHKEIQHHVKIGLSNSARTQLDTNETLPDNMVNIRYCYLCPKTFCNIEQLNVHLGRHRLKRSAMKTIESIVHSTCWPNGKKIIKCKICDLQFTRMVELREHFSPNNHSSKCSRQHSLANYSITNEKGFELHLELDSETESESDAQPKHDKISADSEPLKCQMCNTNFKRKYQIAQHQRSKHNYDILELRCECCVFRTVSQKVLDYHRATQCCNLEKKHRCHQCNFRFMWKENLANHITTFHSPKNSIHVTSNITDPNLQPTPEKGIRPIKRALCPICGISITTESLSYHIKSHKGEKPFKCKLCKMAFTRNADLEDHKLNCADERPFKCTICERSFKRETVLQNHIRYHNNERPYKCNFCSASYITSGRFERHLLEHSGVKQHKCDICGKGFAANSNLKKHRRRTHFANHAFQCKQCKKLFISQHILDSHTRKHTGIYPFECNICQKQFATTQYLRVHMLSHTGEKPFRCAICEQRFKCRSYLLKHMKRHHN